MTTYRLHFRQFDPCDGQPFDIVTIAIDGHLPTGFASAVVSLEGHDGRPGSCTVFVPAHVILDDTLVTDYAPHLLGTSPSSGTRHYTFSHREMALSFLRKIYGIDAPSPDPEPQEDTQKPPFAGFLLTFTDTQDKGCTHVQVIFEAPSYEEPVSLAGEIRQMTVSGKDTATLHGSDLLGWTIFFGERITPDLLEGILVPGVTFRQNHDTITGHPQLVADDFTTRQAAEGFVTYAYERLFEAFYLGKQPNTQQPPPPAQLSTTARPQPPKTHHQRNTQ